VDATCGVDAAERRTDVLDPETDARQQLLSELHRDRQPWGFGGGRGVAVASRRRRRRLRRDWLRTRLRPAGLTA